MHEEIKLFVEVIKDKELRNAIERELQSLSVHKVESIYEKVHGVLPVEINTKNLAIAICNQYLQEK